MDKSYDVIVADPPWKFSSNSKANPGRNAMRHYPCMTDEEIAQIPVKHWAEKDAILFLWITAPMLERALPVMGHWGFKYKSQLVWVKHKIGTGFWARNRHELVLVGTRGRFPCPRPAPFSDSVITAKAREHSRKPTDLQDRIDDVWPEHSKLEIFARTTRPGWEAWGNQTDKFEGAA